MPDEIAREAVGLFHDEKALQRTVDELLIAGVDRSACSLLAGQRAVERRLGEGLRSAGELEDDERVPRIPYIGTDSRTEAKGVAIGGLAYVGAVASLGAVVFSGGTMAAALGAAAALGGVGGLLGAALAAYLGRHHARHLQAQLDAGGLLLWVTVKGAVQESQVLAIMRDNGAEDVHAHGLPAVHPAAMQGGMSYDMSFMRRLGL
jgi:hypothetical protein